MAVIPRLFKEDFALTFFESEAKHRFCFRGCRSVLDQTARIWFLWLLSWDGLGQMTSSSISLLAPGAPFGWLVWFLMLYFHIHFSVNWGVKPRKHVFRTARSLSLNCSNMAISWQIMDFGHLQQTQNILSFAQGQCKCKVWPCSYLVQCTYLGWV